MRTAFEPPTDGDEPSRFNRTTSGDFISPEVVQFSGRISQQANYAELVLTRFGLRITNRSRRGRAKDGFACGRESIVECHPRKDGGVNSAPHVLVIDGTSDTEAVLKAVLEPRGTQVERTRGAKARRLHDNLTNPHVVVIDLDDESADATASYFVESHRILIGSVNTSRESQDRFLSKPFQYPELLRTIEDLLALPPAG